MRQAKLRILSRKGPNTGSVLTFRGDNNRHTVGSISVQLVPRFHAEFVLFSTPKTWKRMPDGQLWKSATQYKVKQSACLISRSYEQTPAFFHPSFVCTVGQSVRSEGLRERSVSTVQATRMNRIKEELVVLSFPILFSTILSFSSNACRQKTRTIVWLQGSKSFRVSSKHKVGK